MKDLSEILEDVVCQKSFLVFVSALIADRKQQEDKSADSFGYSGDWANNTIADFLEGALSWAEDSDFGISQDEEQEPNKWQQFAEFLYCGKVYE